MGLFRRVFSGVRRLVPGLADLRACRFELGLSALSGLAGAFIFPRYHFSTLAWVALVPFFVALARVRGRAVIWCTFLFGFLWYYLSLWWLNTLTVFNTFIPLGAFVLPLVLSLWFVIFAFPASWAFRRQPGWLAPATVAAAWSGVEYLRSLGEIAFPWNLLGYSQGQGLLRAISQWAEVGSVYLVSFFVALFNAGLAVFVVRLMNRPAGEPLKKAFLPGLVTWLAPVTVVLLGWVCALGLEVNARREAEFRGQDQTTATITLAVIQPNVSQLDKWALGDPGLTAEQRRALEYNAQERALSKVRRIAETAPPGERPRLYVLPETTFPDPFFVYNTPLHDELTTLARRAEADLFFGADAREPMDSYRPRFQGGFRDLAAGEKPLPFLLPSLVESKDEQGRPFVAEAGAMAAFNSAWQITPERGLTEVVYHKVRLVPFGETAPILGHIPGFQDYVMTVGSFQSGLEQPIFETAGIPYGAMICFESSFGNLARGLARRGAHMIFVLTNDAWYDPAYLLERGGFFGTLFKLPFLRTLAASGPDQHFQMSVFRAIETRLPVIRSANTGISAIITPVGEVAEKLPFGEEGTLVARVAAPWHKPTAYVRRGEFFPALCLFVIALVSGLELYFRRRSRRGEAV